MIHKRIGNFSLWVFFVSITVVYVSSPNAQHIAHNFDYRSHIEWEAYSSDTSVESMSEETLMKVHPLKGKKIPSLSLLLQLLRDTTVDIKTDTKQKITLQSKAVLEGIQPVNPKDNDKKPFLIPDHNHESKKVRDFEASKDVGLQTKDKIDSEKSKNEFGTALSTPTNLRIQQ